MALDPTHSGILEQLIDQAIKDMQATVQFVRSDRYSKIIKDKDGDDFVLGYIIGRIDTTFKATYIATFDKLLSNEEILEIENIIYNRIGELKEAIFKCG